MWASVAKDVSFCEARVLLDYQDDRSRQAVAHPSKDGHNSPAYGSGEIENHKPEPKPQTGDLKKQNEGIKGVTLIISSLLSDPGSPSCSLKVRIARTAASNSESAKPQPCA